MEEADNILIMGLRDIGCAVAADVRSVKQLLDSDASSAYLACAAYVRIIDPEREIPETLPRHMSARVAACTALAGAIKELGYRGDLGYHQILYPNDSDLRQLLMFLSKSVPEQTTAASAASGDHAPGGDGHPQSARAALAQRLGAELTAIAKSQWTARVFKPSPLQLPLHAAPLKLPSRGPAMQKLPGLEAYYRDHLPAAALQPRTPADLAASVFEAVALSLADAKSRENDRQAALEGGLNPAQYREKRRAAISAQVASSFRTTLAQSANAAASAANRDSLASLLQNYGAGGAKDGGRFARQVKYETEEASAVPQETAEERFAKLEKELEEALSALSKVQGEAAEVAAAMQAFDEQQRRAEGEAREEDAKLVALEREYRVKKRTFDLLPEAEANIAELQRIADGSAQRLVTLAAEWEKRRAPLVDELRKLQDLQDAAMGESRAKLEEIKKVRAEMKQLIEEIRQKEDRCKQLVEAYKAMANDQSRAGYTRRILDVVKNVKKQKLDITRILEDTRVLQKEINSVRDTLGRSFSVADELIFQDAKKEAAKPPKQQDTTKRDIYKQLVALNESFEKLVAAIEETGHTRGSILNLEAKIDQLQTRTAALNMDRILDDLKQVREANEALQKKLDELQAH